MSADPAAFHHLWLLLENHRPVAVHRHLIPIAGSAKAALFLSQLVYWTRRNPSALSAPGWIHKTSAQWFRELGLSRREQETARAALKSLDVLEEGLRGQPAMRYYRLRLPQLGQLLTVRLVPRLADTDPGELWTDEALVRELLGRALPYQRILAYLTGSVNAALLLTRVIFLHRRHLHVQGWFRFSRGAMEQELGLTRWELDTARKCLRGKSLVEERLAYLPTRLYARAVPPAIVTALRRLDTGRTSEPDREVGVARSANHDAGFSAGRRAPKRQPDSRDSRQSACTKATPQFGGKPGLGLAENLPSKDGVITDVHLTTTAVVAPAPSSAASSPDPVAEAVVVPNSDHRAGTQAEGARVCLTVRHLPVDGPAPPAPDPAGRFDGHTSLTFPAEFLPEERQILAAELAALPVERAQLVLDEVAGRSRKQRSVHTRVGLVRSLAQAERQGHFRPAYAWEIRDTRRRAAQREAEPGAGQGPDSRLPEHLTTCIAGKTGYEAFKEIAARWRRKPVASVPSQTNKEDPT